MTYLVTATVTYSTAGNRNTAMSNINAAVAGFSLSNVSAGGLPSGIQNSGTTALTMSFQCSDADFPSLHSSLTTAWASATRVTTGYVVSAVKI